MKNEDDVHVDHCSKELLELVEQGMEIKLSMSHELLALPTTSWIKAKASMTARISLDNERHEEFIPLGPCGSRLL